MIPISRPPLRRPDDSAAPRHSQTRTRDAATSYTAPKPRRSPTRAGPAHRPQPGRQLWRRSGVVEECDDGFADLVSVGEQASVRSTRDHHEMSVRHGLGGLAYAFGRPRDVVFERDGEAASLKRRPPRDALHVVEPRE